MGLGVMSGLYQQHTRETTMRETYCFENLQELRDWLNSFATIDLSTVWPENDYIRLTWSEVEMVDGFSVYNVSISS